MNHTYGVCYWDYVICDAKTGHNVKRILIEGKQLYGTIPTELGLLHELIELSLPNNELFGSIPEEITRLKNLEVVNLGGNSINCSVPKFASASLSRLNLTKNELYGTLPHDIGQWHPGLKSLDVSHNQITGHIPPTFNRCKKLDSLDVSDNQITGTIPYTLGSCTKLKYLYLNQNNIMGSLPPQIAMPNAILEELWLFSNLMSGTIPASMADLPKLFDFYIDGNKFTGTVPTELCNETINTDFFANFEGDAEKDFCESIACPPGYYSVMGLYPCVPCPVDTFSPYLGHRDNCYSTDQQKIMMLLFAGTDGPNWDLPVKWAGADHCSFQGVDCNSRQEIVGIDLKGMGLKGTIPSELGFLRFLNTLDLSDNLLTGFVPADLMWPPLTALDLSGNMIKGIVPPELCFEQGINGNGEDGKYSCRSIACPTGTYSSTGIGHPLDATPSPRDANQEVQCQPCITAKFLASKQCDLSNVTTTTQAATTSSSYNDISKEAIFSVFLIVFFTLSGCVYLSYTRLRAYKLKRRPTHGGEEMNEDSEWHVDDYDSEMKILRNQAAPTDVEIGSDDELEMEEKGKTTELTGILS